MASVTVGQVMQKYPAFVSPSDDVRTAVELLRQHELRGLPVLDEERHVVGIVTESDLVLEEEDSKLHLPHYIDIMGGVIFLEPLKNFEHKLRKAFATSVRDMMTSPAETVNVDQTAHQAARIMAKRGHSQLPVVDGDGVLVGVVTRVDILRAIAE